MLQLHSSRRGVCVHIWYTHVLSSASDVSIPAAKWLHDPIPPAQRASCLFLPKEMRINACRLSVLLKSGTGLQAHGSRRSLCRAGSHPTKALLQARSRFPKFQTQSDVAHRMPPKRARLETEKAILRLCMLPKRTSFLAIFWRRGCTPLGLEIVIKNLKDENDRCCTSGTCVVMIFGPSCRFPNSA